MTSTRATGRTAAARWAALLVLTAGLAAGCQQNPETMRWEPIQPQPWPGLASEQTPDGLDRLMPAMAYQIEPIPAPTPAPVRPAVAEPEISVRTVLLGKSVKGREIHMHVFGEGDSPTLIFGGIHGEEGTAAQLAEKLLAHLRANHDLLPDGCVAIIPRANPDGLAVGRRVNAHGVDLNRNFPAKNFQASARYGQTPASEPETRALLKAVETLQPGRIISIHSCRRGRHGNNWDGAGKTLADAMAAFNGYKSFGEWHNPTPGSFGNWAGVDRKMVVVTLELPNDLSGEQCWQQNRQALLAAIRAGAAVEAKIGR